MPSDPLTALYSQVGNAPAALSQDLRQNKLINANILSQQGQDNRAQAQFDLNQQNAQAEAARNAQYSQLLAGYLGPDQGAIAAQDMGQGGAPQGPSQGQNAMLSQLYQLDPQRTQQLVQFQQQQAAAQQAKQKDEATQVVRSAQYVLQSESPKSLMKMAFPDLVDGLKQHGVDIEEMDDNHVRELAKQTIAQYGPAAGIGVTGPGEGFTLGQGQKRFDAQGREVASVAPAPKEGDDPNDKNFTRANVLRDEYNAQAAPFATIKSAYENIKAAERGDAGDTALAVNYMKLINPSARINPGDSVEDIASIPGVSHGVAALYHKVVGGGHLDDSRRAELRSQANSIFKTQADLNKAIRKKYTNLARISEVDPAFLGMDADESAPAAQPAAAGGGAWAIEPVK